jgi:hypothetical protein
MLTVPVASMATPTPQNWPKWAPPALVDRHQLLAPLAQTASVVEPTFQIKIAETIETLCTDSRMEAIWEKIDRHAIKPDYHCDLAESVTIARWPPHGFQRLTPEQFLQKRNQGAAAARKLRNILEEMGLGNQTVFPVIGAEAMSGPILFFSDAQDAATDTRKLTHGLKALNKVMMDNHPGVGTWRDVLDRLAVSIETDGMGWTEYRRVKGEGDTEGRARNFSMQVGRFLRELCGRPLVTQTVSLTEIFFPDATIDREALRKAIQRQNLQR